MSIESTVRRARVSRWALAASVLFSAAIAPAARASGQRGTELSEAKIETFIQLGPDALAKQSLHYVGSTAKWHVFMRVDTAVGDGHGGGGMPFDHLSTYKVAVGAVTIVHGWTIHFSDETIEANKCPLAVRTGDKPPTWEVPGDAETRATCGT